MSTDLTVLWALALVRVLLHTLTNGQYGFHRDELGILDDARHLAWGYVAYPPLTPALARVARDLGGGRWAQVVAAVAVAVAPISLLMGALFQYVGFDYLWWTVVASCAI